MAKKQQKNPWSYIFTILIVLFIFSYLISSTISAFVDGDSIGNGNVAIIPVKGVIVTQSDNGLFDSDVADSTSIVQFIEEAAANPQVEALLIEIDSPGGAPVASDEIATALKDVNKTTVAWIREVGASGAYWVASSTDYVVANKLSITGSIGVLGSYLEFSGLLEEYNVTYQQFNGGEFKDLGTPFRKLSEKEQRVLQKKIDLIHQVFKDEVQANRGLTKAQIDASGNGEFYLGSEALSLGLVDELGGKKEALSYIEQTLNITAQTTSFKQEESFLDVLGKLSNNNNLFPTFKPENRLLLR